MYQFDCPEPVALSLRIAAGDAEIVAEEGGTEATVDIQPVDDSDASRSAAERTRVEMRDGTLVVEGPEWTGMLFRRGPRVQVQVRLPADGPLNVTVASADVTATGRFGAANLNTSSGDLTVDHVTGPANVKAASGDVRLGRVDAEARVNSASGDITVGQVAGDLSANSASGDVTVDRAAGSVKVTTASGDVQVGAVSSGQVKINSASGDVSVGVLPGIGVWLDLTSLSGDTNTDLAMPQGTGGGDPGSATLNLQVRTASGDIDVRRAYAGAAA